MRFAVDEEAKAFAAAIRSKSAEAASPLTKVLDMSRGGD